MTTSVGTNKSCTKVLQHWVDYEQWLNLITESPAIE